MVTPLFNHLHNINSMKKTLLLVAVTTIALGMNAQHVSKVDIQLTKYNIDSLHTAYVNNPTGILLQLEIIKDAQEVDAQKLKDVNKELNQEKDYAKSLDKYVSSAISNCKSTKKNFESNKKNLQKMRDVAADQQAKIRKLDLVQDPQKETYIKQFNDQANRWSNQLKSSDDEVSYLDQQINELEGMKTKIESLENEIKAKEEQIKQLETSHKENKKQVAEEVKIAKAAKKAQR